MTKKLVVANWKMELSHKAATEAMHAILKLVKKEPPGLELVICPSFPSLAELVQEVERVDAVSLGAQNVHWEERGAWTGEVSVAQLAPFTEWCIVGHSERRALTGENDEQVALKVSALQQRGITPIVCVGESREEYDAGETNNKITRQMQSVLATQQRSTLNKLVITYEPIWAVSAREGSELADPDDISEAMLLIRKLVAEQFDADGAQQVRVLYGGSVNGKNAASVAGEPGVDGVLVGSASIHPRELLEIVAAVDA